MSSMTPIENTQQEGAALAQRTVTNDQEAMRTQSMVPRRRPFRHSESSSEDEEDVRRPQESSDTEPKGWEIDIYNMSFSSSDSSDDEVAEEPDVPKQSTSDSAALPKPDSTVDNKPAAPTHPPRRAPVKTMPAMKEKPVRDEPEVMKDRNSPASSETALTNSSTSASSSGRSSPKSDSDDDKPISTAPIPIQRRAPAKRMPNMDERPVRDEPTTESRKRRHTLSSDSSEGKKLPRMEEKVFRDTEEGNKENIAPTKTRSTAKSIGNSGPGSSGEPKKSTARQSTALKKSPVKKVQAPRKRAPGGRAKKTPAPAPPQHAYDPRAEAVAISKTNVRRRQEVTVRRATTSEVFNPYNPRFRL